jgi:ATP-binding cassette subfamily F protein 3
MITVDNLTKGFGSHVLFEEASFAVGSHERVGLVGRNGHGKTTLFRLIVGQEQADSGTINIPKHYRIGYVQQKLEFTENNILAEAIKGLQNHEKDHSWKVEKVLAGLGFSQTDMQRRPEEFSGGFQVRLNLAKVLVSESDMLLLDEPTNYLDITSLRWLERFLLKWPRELMLITHDRSFMDKLATHVIGIYRKKIRKIQGNTEKYYEQIAREEEIYEKTRINDDRRCKEIELFINRFRAKARLANLVQSRIKTLEKTEKRIKLENIKALEFSFRSKPFYGDYLMNVDGLSFSYNSSEPLIKDFSISIKSRDRICVIGRNGKGKTTLLKILAGKLTPKKGEIHSKAAVQKGYFEQTNVASLVESRTVEEEILSVHPGNERQHVRDICGAMLFEGDHALKKIKVLSGGEKSRVMLGKILVTPVNLLLLDEVTNHLDMESCDSLLAALDSFDGAVIMVTHNEMFLHALAKRLIVFQSSGITVFEDTYQSFLEDIGWEEEGQVQFSRQIENKTPSSPKLNKKELRRLRSELITERSHVLKPLEQRISHIEQDIEANELRIKELNDEMIVVSQSPDGAKISEISIALHSCKKNIDKLFDELEERSNTYEEKSRYFKEELEKIMSEEYG